MHRTFMGTRKRVPRTVSKIIIATVGAAGLTLALAAPSSGAPTGAADTADAGGTTAAQVTDSATTAAPPAVVDAVAEALDLSLPQATALLETEDDATALEKQMRAELGGSYAGTRVLADTAKIQVSTTDRSEASAIRAAGGAPRVVETSEQRLDAVKADLDGVSRPAPSKVAGWYVDLADNTVVVIARPGGQGAAKAFARRAGVTDAVDIRVANETPRTLYDVRGGDAYYPGSSRCSVGLAVSGGFVTAGHCGSTGTSTSGFNRVAQGSVAGSIFPGNDMGWVRVNSNWTPVPRVNRYQQGSDITVVGGTEAAVGAAICRSGSTTGYYCGTIQAKNQTVNYAQGAVRGMTRTNVCAEPGDSGGGWITPSGQGQGVTSGGSGNCSSGGTTYFQPLNPILSRYNLTLTTSGGGQPPTGCNQLPETFSGSLSGTGDSDQHPNGTYWYSSSGGSFAGCLRGPSNADFDLYLYRWSGSAWSIVGRGESSNSNEDVTYNGSSGYYTWLVRSYSGSGSYSFSMNRP